MKNKKYIYASIFIIIILAILVIMYASSRDKNKPLETVLEYDQGQSLRYNPHGGQLEISSGENFEQLSTLPLNDSRFIVNVDVSPEKDAVLYSSIKEYGEDEVIEGDDNPESQYLYVKRVNEDQPSKVENTFSASWLNKGEIIYQDINTGEVVVFSLESNEEKYREDYDLAEMTELHPLSETMIIAIPYSYDVSESQAEIIDLKNNSKADYLSGTGLQIKTILGTPYFMFTRIQDESQVATVVEWRTGQEIYTTSDTGPLTWDKDGNLYSIKESGEYERVSI